MGFLIFLVIVVAAFAAWRMRVPLLAKILGQDQARVERRLNQRKR